MNEQELREEIYEDTDNVCAVVNAAIPKVYSFHIDKRMLKFESEDSVYPDHRNFDIHLNNNRSANIDVDDDLAQDCILWVDVETTGLDPQRHSILEASVVLTTEEGDALLDWHWVRQDSNNMKWQIDVVNMHRESGLIDDLNSSYYRGTDLELSDSIYFFAGLVDSPMLGGTGPHFDKAFLKEEGASFETVSYRHMDTRSIIQLCKAAGIEMHECNEHRSFPDIVNSIKNYKRAFKALKDSVCSK